jgi:serine/threonine protein kinase
MGSTRRRIGLDVWRRWRRRTAGIVYRDVKPANVLVSDQGRAWPTDVRITSSTGEGRLTGHGVIIGSPSYIAPERARGDSEPGRVADVRVVATQPYQLRVVSPRVAVLICGSDGGASRPGE